MWPNYSDLLILQVIVARKCHFELNDGFTSASNTIMLLRS